ncbi:hypothetical protein EBME_0830 [bacterium endosymbiont of Mortierella elongata FMR23-6]|nr:hypothetical protein EBME_0830 [bacterium endosymbiont of Mortierella elongata FMR23-6]
MLLKFSFSRAVNLLSISVIYIVLSLLFNKFLLIIVFPNFSKIALK